MGKYVVMILMCLASLKANAEEYWSIRDVVVEDVEFFYENGNNVLRVLYSLGDIGGVDVEPGQPIGCLQNTVPVSGQGTQDPSDDIYQASLLHANTSADQKMHVSQLLSAQAQGALIDIRIIHGDSCRSDTRYGYTGLGKYFNGIRIKRVN